MVTERHTMKISTEFTADARKELHGPSIKTSNKLLIGSSIGAVAFILIIFVSAYFDKQSVAYAALGFFMFDMFVLLLGVTVRRSINKALRAPLPHTVFDYEIFDGGIAAKETVDGEVLHVSKYYNKVICKTLESAHYFFLYVNNTTALVIDKSTLYPAELDTIKATYFKKPGEHVLQLAPFKPGVPTFVQPPEQNEN